MFGVPRDVVSGGKYNTPTNRVFLVFNTMEEVEAAHDAWKPFSDNLKIHLWGSCELAPVLEIPKIIVAEVVNDG